MTIARRSPFYPSLYFRPWGDPCLALPTLPTSRQAAGRRLPITGIIYFGSWQTCFLDCLLSCLGREAVCFLVFLFLRQHPYSFQSPFRQTLAFQLRYFIFISLSCPLIQNPDWQLPLKLKFSGLV